MCWHMYVYRLVPKIPAKLPFHPTSSLSGKAKRRTALAIAWWPRAFPQNCPIEAPGPPSPGLRIEPRPSTRRWVLRPAKGYWKGIEASCTPCGASHFDSKSVGGGFPRHSKPPVSPSAVMAAEASHSKCRRLRKRVGMALLSRAIFLRWRALALM